jgi:hypothetical protein
MINGAGKLKLRTPMRSPLSLGGGVVKIRGDGLRDCYVIADSGDYVIDGTRAEMRRGESMVESSSPPCPPSPVALLVNLGQHNETVEKVLRLAGKEVQDWTNIYRIFEIIQDETGSAVNQWQSKPTITRFTRTANSVAAVGDEARHGIQHGIQKDEPPEEPMTLAEAQVFISSLISKWLERKQS